MLSSAFFLPTFEIETGVPIPKNKRELRKLFDAAKVIFFHRDICKSCHQIPDGEKWFLDENVQNMEVYASTKRQKEFYHWEPVFISSNNVSFFLILFCI
jgi:hypothetical protein